MSQNNEFEYELTILMPCLNEAETLEVCIQKAQTFLKESGVNGEILIADNGSTDGSQDIARRNGARVVDVPVKGYGAALIGGCNAALGEYVIMGDSDDSYDFLHLMPFVEKLREGYDLVMGNRFKGGIEKGAMPFSHRYIGNPILSFIGRLFYPSKIGDFHCGLRGYNTERMRSLDLKTTGMEYASEMVVKSTLYGFKITEVPTTLKKDGRSHAPHLNTMKDGWRHLKFLLMHSPKWLFLYPGIILSIIGAVFMGILIAGPLTVGSVTFDVQTLLYASAMLLLGTNMILFSAYTGTYARTTGFIPMKEPKGLMKFFTVEKGIILGIILFIAGIAASILSVNVWSKASFGELDPTRSLRLIIPAFTAIVLGAQLIFASFFIGILQIKHK
ncbi:MAG: glycosyltransferase family 2 protein [Butyrivibrio sp.]